MRPLLLAAALTLAGCAGTVRTASPDGGLAEVSRAVAGRTVTVVLRDGGEYPARSLLLAADSARWTEPETGRDAVAPTPALAEVRVPSRRSNAGRGAGVGAAIGGALGLAVMVPLTGDIPFVGGTVALAYSGLTAASGALYGALFGSGSRTVDRYVLAPTDGRTFGGVTVRPRPAPDR